MSDYISRVGKFEDMDAVEAKTLLDEFDRYLKTLTATEAMDITNVRYKETIEYLGDK
jgi:hypothetical protein